MATPDFSKIWGSAAEQKYNFSDDDYVRGWQFIGSTPPSRQMFDAWMRSGDEKNKYLYDIMSDAFGATSPGGIAIDDTKVPTSDKNNLNTLLSNLANVEKGIIGGTSWRDNPAITLAAMSAFVQQLAAGSDVEWSGSTWKNKKLGMTGLMAQNGYISFGQNFGGLIIQWGSAIYGIIYFPVSFTSNPVLFDGYWGSQFRIHRFSNVSNSKFQFDTYDISSGKSNVDSSYDGMWLAIGI